jgi:hypothetical protein
MRILTKAPPDGHRLFRVVLVASVTAWLLGGLVLLALWEAVDCPADVGQEFLWILGILGTIFAVATVTHYPWGPRWCKALGSKYQETQGKGGAGAGNHV